MPNYDYECLSCEHKFEVFQGMNDKPLTKCPKCGKSVRRLIGSGVGIIFKGSGFYQTDYKNKSKSSTSKKDASGDNCSCCKDSSCSKNKETGK
ncbi:MAG: zinc ribbon domain-containing protein [Candidatus Gygaella obscura]|nr:zinc ribbon domain-containing protein [Candidatus Gygaella obscura]